MDKKKAIFTLILVFLVSLSFFLRTFPLSNVHYWDETVYLQNAEIIMGLAEGGYELDFRPPFLPLFIALLNLIWHSPYIAQIGVGMLSALGAVPLFLLIKKKFNVLMGFIAFVMFSFSPLLLLEAKGILTDNIALSFFIFAVYFLDKEIEEHNGKNKHINQFLAALFLVLSILSKFTYIFGILFLVLFLYFKRAKLKDYVWVGGLTLFFLLPYFIWNFIEFGNPVYTFLKGSSVVSQSPSDPFLFYLLRFDYLGELPIIIGIILLGFLFFWNLFNELNRRRKKERLKLTLIKALSIWGVLLFLALSLMTHKETRYLFPIFFVLIALSAAGYWGFIRFFRKNTKVLLLIKVGIVVFVCVFYAFSTIHILRTHYYGLENNYPEQFIDVSKWISSSLPDDKPIYALTHYPLLNYYSDKVVIPAKPQTSSATLLNCSRQGFRSFGITTDQGYFVSFPKGYDEKVRVPDHFFSECNYFEEIYRSGNEGDFGVVYSFEID